LPQIFLYDLNSNDGLLLEVLKKKKKEC